MFDVFKRKAVGTLLTFTFLAGCGGGGGDSQSPKPGPSAEGVYGGTLTGSTSTAFQLLVLENGDLWSLYGTQTPTQFGVAGFVQGSGTSNNGSFTSSNARDFGVTPAVTGTTTATYDATAKTISGTVSSGTSTITFNGGPIAGSLYNYNTIASLTSVIGSWSTTSLTGESVAINIGSTGTFSAATSLGCNFTGTFMPRASGKNVFNVAINFGAAPCALPGQSATGIAVAYPLSNGKMQLLGAAVDGTRSFGVAVFGTR